jgi:multiple sugar transport system substrate-binding protein
MAEYAKKLNKVDNDGNLTVAGFIPDFSWSHLDHYTRMFGGGYYSNDGTKITLASDPVVQALEWEKQFYLTPGPEQVDRLKSGFGDYESPQAGFYAGKVAMMVEGEWQPTFIKKFAPNLRYGVAPIPYPAAHSERKGTALVYGTVVGIPSNVKDVDRVWKMLAWMEKPENLTDIMLNNGNLPTSKQGLVDARFREDPNFAVFMDLMNSPNATGPVYTPIQSEMSEKLGMIEENVNKGQVSDIKAELESAQTELQPKLDEALQEQK